MVDFNEKYQNLRNSTETQSDEFKAGILNLKSEAETEGEELWAIFFSARLDFIDNNFPDNFK